MKAVILTRVSSAEQTEGHSLAAQKHRLEQYCARRGLQVIQIFEIVESSTRGSRKEFQALLQFIRAQKELVALVADKVDRVQRSFRESVILDDLVKQEKLELHFYTEGMIIGRSSKPHELLQWDFAVLGARSYTLNLSENVRRSFEQKRRNGEWTGPAPLGYRNTRVDGRAHIEPDPDTAPVVRRLFEMYASGLYPLSALVKFAHGTALRAARGGARGIGKSHVHQLLQNPFYYGMMRFGDQLLAHRYQPLITLQLFEECERVRLSRSSNPAAAARQNKHEFLFRGMLQCGVTGGLVVSDRKFKTLTDGNVNEYIYLLTYEPGQPGKRKYVREEVVEKQVMAALRRLYIPPDVMLQINERLQASVDSEREYHRAQVKALQQKAAALEEKKERLLDLLLERHITPEVYNAKQADLMRETQRIQEAQKSSSSADAAFGRAIASTLQLASRTAELFASSTMQQKRQIMKMVFSNQILKGATLCYEMRFPFCEFEKPANSTEWLRVVDAIRTTHRQSFLLFINKTAQQ